MTNTRNYYTSSNYANTIPIREEFHRYASNVLSIGDFDTNYTNGYQIDKVDAAIQWTISSKVKIRKDNLNE